MKVYSNGTTAVFFSSDARFESFCTIICLIKFLSVDFESNLFWWKSLFPNKPVLNEPMYYVNIVGYFVDKTSKTKLGTPSQAMY